MKPATCIAVGQTPPSAPDLRSGSCPCPPDEGRQGRRPQARGLAPQTNTGWSICILVCVCAAAFAASPVDFGTAELDAAIDARNFKYKPKVMAELDIEAPETFRIELYAAGGAHITGGDLRGLMYGLLEASEQMRTTGRLKKVHGVPALALRGVRINASDSAYWLASAEFWQTYFPEMARDRFNRLELAFDSSPSPDAYQAIRTITQIAQQFGVDVAIGFGAPTVAGIKEMLLNCPAIRAVVLHGETFPGTNELLEALHDSGRRVVLELPDIESAASLIEAAGQSGAPLRLFAPFSESAPNPRPRDSYWAMDPSQSADATNSISGAGFEVASPLDNSARPVIGPIAEWGRFGYTRPEQ